MEQNMFPRTVVQEEMKKKILVRLYTDGQDEDSKKNAKFQEDFTKTYSLPVYAVVSPDGKLLRVKKDRETDESKFAGFLRG